MRRVDIVHKSHPTVKLFVWIMRAPYVMIVDCVLTAEVERMLSDSAANVFRNFSLCEPRIFLSQNV